MRKQQCLLCRRTLATATAYCQGKKRTADKANLTNQITSPSCFSLAACPLHMYFLHGCQTGSTWWQTQTTDIQAWARALSFPWKRSLSFSQGKQTISLPDQYLLTAINPERAREHFYVNYVNLNSLATRDVRGAIQLSKLDGGEGREIKNKRAIKRGHLFVVPF